MVLDIKVIETKSLFEFVLKESREYSRSRFFSKEYTETMLNIMRKECYIGPRSPVGDESMSQLRNDMIDKLIESSNADNEEELKNTLIMCKLISTCLRHNCIAII